MKFKVILLLVLGIATSQAAQCVLQQFKTNEVVLLPITNSVVAIKSQKPKPVLYKYSEQFFLSLNK